MNEKESKILKKELHNQLKRLIVLTQKEDYSKYMKMKKDYNRLYSNIFKEHNEESFKWDLARNKLDGIFTLKNYLSYGKISKEQYENNKKHYLTEAMKILEELKRYL